MASRCRKCGSVNDPNNKFCASCGAKFVPIEEARTTGEDGEFFCYKHSKVTTRVTCGRCERPICDRCMVIGSNGVRCKECARNRVSVRPGGVAHDISRGIGRTVNSVGTKPIWYLWIWSTIIRIIASFFGR